MSNPALRFAVRGEGTDVLEIDVYDAIGESWWGEGVSAKSVRAALRGAQDTKRIRLRVNSTGGDVIDGFAIYNLLNEHPAHVEADVDALAASMASVIIMAADEIRIAKNAMIMIHNPWALAMGDAEDLRGTADVLDKMRAQIADAYVARTGLDRDRVIEMMDAETWLTADEAKEHGFADVVKPTKKGPEKTKALASLDSRGWTRAPAMFAAAIERARSTSNHARAESEAHESAADAVEETTIMSDEELTELRSLLGLSEEATGQEILDAVRALMEEETDEGEGGGEDGGEAATEQPAAALAEARASLQTVTSDRDTVRAQRDELQKRVDRFEAREWLDGEITARGLAVKPEKRAKWVDMALAKGRDVVTEILDGQSKPPTGAHPLAEQDARAERERPKSYRAAVDACMKDAREACDPDAPDHIVRAKAQKLAAERWPDIEAKPAA